MKKRFLSLLLAVCILLPIFAVPAAAVNANTAIQTARTMGVLDAATAQSPEALAAPVTRGEFARMLTMVSSYRETVNEQILVGSLFTDVNSSTANAPYIRIAVQQNWLTGYTDGTFRPEDPVTLEAACASALRLLGFAPSDLTGAFPAAQLNKATELGLRAGLARSQGETMTRSDCAVLLYNTLIATTKSGSTYGNTIGLSVSDGQVDTSTILASSLKGPFIAGASEMLPISPTTVYRNDEVTDSLELNVNDVYYYSESLNAVWIYTTKASGRITSVSPNAAAPTSVTVAGVTYQIGSTDVAYRISSLSGGGVGQVVTLLLGMEDVAVGILTGEEVDLSYYGVVQASSRSLTLDNNDTADVMQTVRVLCTDGTVRTGIYQKECDARNIEALSPPEDIQKLVMSIIYDEIKRGETGSREKFAAIDRWLRQAGCDGAILGCTELSVYRTYHGLPDYYLDAMDVLAQRCITACGYKLRLV